MSEAQRIIVRIGLSTDVPALHQAELGMDIDTITMRIGDDTADPPKIMTTKSTGSFDYSSTDVVTFHQIAFAPGGGVSGINFDSMKADQGVVISLGNGQFRECEIFSSDGSVIVTNGKGQSGDIDITVSPDSISNAVADLKQSIVTIQGTLDSLGEESNDQQDTLLKLVQLTGRPAKQTDLGTFTGSVIPDGATIKTALQALETAVQNVDSSAFHLEITGQDGDQLGLKLTDNNIVILTSASHTLAGLMSAADKTKLDTFDLPTIQEQGITLISAGSDDVQIDQTNGVSKFIPASTTSTAGVMSASDKVKMDDLTVTAPHNIDTMDDRITVLETTLSTSFFIETSDAPLFSTGDKGGNLPDVATTFAVPLSGLKAFGVYYNRMVDGYDPETYDEITANGVTIVPSEHVTKTYTGVVTIYKARDSKWYYLNKYGIGVFLADSAATTITIAASATNEFAIRKLTIV